MSYIVSHLNPTNPHRARTHFGPKHLFDLSPKLAHLVETVSLESKGFQTGVMLGGAWWRAAVLLPMRSC